MMADQPISEDDLQAYVDDRLDGTRRLAVESYMAEHAEVASRVTDYSEQRLALRAALAPIATEPVPPELDMARLVAERRRRPDRIWWHSAAASIVALIAGASGGWFARSATSTPTNGVLALVQEAADSYAVFEPDRVRPVEIRADDREGLVSWVSKRLDRSVTVPDLTASGYRLMGGRVVATPHGAAGLFMYDDDHGSRVAMLVRPMAISEPTRMAERTDGAVAGFAWADRGMGYSLVGAASPATLHPLADEARRQLVHDT